MKKEYQDASLASRYRPNAAAIITDGTGRVLLCRRVDIIRGVQYIQTVQGGIDAGETVEAAALREACEELGVLPEDVTILATCPTTYQYRWDSEEIFPGSPFHGQEQTFVLLQVHDDIAWNLDAHHRKFSDVWWGTPDELLAGAWERKRPGLKGAMEYFGLL